MWFRRRYRTPWWIVLLAALGVRSLWVRSEMSSEQREAYRAKRRRFREKIREAFDVFKEPEPDEPGTSVEDQP
jgi:hypothetical protein